MENASYELNMPTMGNQLFKDVSCGVSSYVHMFFRFMKTLIVTYSLASSGDNIIYLVIGHCVCNLFFLLLGDAICCTFSPMCPTHVAWEGQQHDAKNLPNVTHNKGRSINI
jgi:hypothetical protein